MLMNYQVATTVIVVEVVMIVVVEAVTVLKLIIFTHYHASILHYGIH